MTEELIIKNKISSWIFKNLDSDNIINYLNTLENDKKYILNDDNKNYNLLESCIFKISQNILEKENLSFDETKQYIEFYKYNKNSLDIEYNKKEKKSPIISSIFILSDVKNQLLFTDININSYKYKEIPEENNLNIIFTQKNKFISFDSSKYFGFYKYDNEINNYCLLINIWDNKSNIIPSKIYNNSSAYIPIDIRMDIQEINSNIYRKNIKNLSIMENILYNYTEENIKEINEIILTDNEFEDLKNTYDRIIITNNINSCFDKDYLINKFGDIIYDYLPFINNFDEIKETNKFNNNKIIKNILSNDICFWIINECEIYNVWSKSKYINYPTYLNLELLPSVLKLVKFLMNFWITQVRHIYKIDNFINIKILDIFITKYTKNNYSEIKNKDDTFLSLNIQLNDKLEFERGDIFFKENESIFINQGDMIIYNGKRERTSGIVTNGNKYILVILLELLF